MAPIISTVSASFNSYGLKKSSAVGLGVSSYSGFISNASIGSNILLAGQLASRTVPVVSAPDGNKSIRFPITWPSSSFVSDSQNLTWSFTMASGDFDILSDIDYIFNGGFIGVGQVSGASEACCDTYSMTFSGIQLFSLRGSVTSQYYKIAFSGLINTNSGIVRYTTDTSVNGGSGLFGNTGFIYLS